MSILQASNLMAQNTLVISAMGIVKISKEHSLEMSVGDGSQDPTGSSAGRTVAAAWTTDRFTAPSSPRPSHTSLSEYWA